MLDTVERKIYIAKNDFSLLTYLTVKGKKIKCLFTGGFFNQSETRNGSFSTSDKDVQDALEKSPRFNQDYVLVSVNGIPLHEYLDNTKVEEEKSLSKEGFTELQANKKQLAIEELKTMFPDLEVNPKATNAQLEAIANEHRCTFVNLAY